jgi:hypothetical protein
LNVIGEESATILTTTTGSLDIGVANDGFTTFMVRPWRLVVQLDATRRSDVCFTILVIGHEPPIHQIQNVVDILSVLFSPDSRGKSEFLLWAGPAETLSEIKVAVRRECFRLTQP